MEIVLRLKLFGDILPLTDVVEPTEPTLKVGIALVHHFDVLLSFFVDYIEFR